MYYLRKYILSKSNYKIYNKELLIIMRYLEIWDTELRNIFKGFDIVINHKKNEYFVKKQCLNKW